MAFKGEGGSSESKGGKKKKTAPWGPFSRACPSRSHVSLADETGEAGSWNFASDGEQNIPDDKHRKSRLVMT